jgi:gluconate 2-dehydrogenase gamma chain
MRRRKFLHTAAIAAAGTAAGCGSSTGRWRFLRAEEARTLDAICGCVIPADGDAGAVDAGVVHYIDRQLTRRFREHQQTYRDGIAAANRLAGGDFSAADAARRLDAIEQLERAPETRSFFNLVVTHSMQGFYGNPRHGGNRDFASWRMLRIPPAQVRGRDRSGA